jgi:hypothetical protein
MGALIKWAHHNTPSHSRIPMVEKFDNTHGCANTVNQTIGIEVVSRSSIFNGVKEDA